MTADPTILGQVAELNFLAPPQSWTGLFDHLQVWRSSDPAGPFTELTGPQWAPPRLPIGGGDKPSVPGSGRLLDLDGLTLSVLLDEQRQVDIVFATLGLIPISTAAAAVTAGSGGLLQAWVDSNGIFVLESYEAGNDRILRVLPTDAAVLLGLPTTYPDCYAYGRDARITLAEGVDTYQFVDSHSQKVAYYKTRYSSSSSLDVSEFSIPFPSVASSASAADVVRGVLDLVDASGRPKQNREVTASVRFSGQQVDRFSVVDTQLSALSDSNGHVEFLLIRGSKVTIVVSGTKLARDITVPMDPAVKVFNLFDPGVGSDDLFVVQKPSIDWAVRRSF